MQGIVFRLRDNPVEVVRAGLLAELLSPYGRNADVHFIAQRPVAGGHATDPIGRLLASIETGQRDRLLLGNHFPKVSGHIPPNTELLQEGVGSIDHSKGATAGNHKMVIDSPEYVSLRGQTLQILQQPFSKGFIRGTASQEN